MHLHINKAHFFKHPFTYHIINYMFIKKITIAVLLRNIHLFHYFYINRFECDKQ